MFTDTKDRTKLCLWSHLSFGIEIFSLNVSLKAVFPFGSEQTMLTWVNELINLFLIPAKCVSTYNDVLHHKSFGD